MSDTREPEALPRQAPISAGSALPGAVNGDLVRMDGAKALGWALDPSSPDQPVAVELLINGEVVDRAIAREPEPDGSAAPSEISGRTCWFALKAPAEHRTGRELVLQVRVAATGQPIGSTLTTRLFGGLKGKFVDVHDGLARGWVSNPFVPGELPSLELSIDGDPGEPFVADLRASDAQRQRFEVPLPGDLQDGEVHKVSVFWAGTKVELPGSPVTWKAPEPRARGVRIVTRAEFGRARPPYAMPRAETVVPQDLLARAAIAERLPEAVAEHGRRLRRLLTAPPRPGPTTRLILFLSGSSLDDLEVSFGLTQLLELPHLSVQPNLILASEEAVRFAADQARATRMDQLVRLVSKADLRLQLERLSDDDLVAFLPVRAVALPAMISAIDSVAQGQTDAAAGVCGAVGVAADGLIWAAPVAAPRGSETAVDLLDAAAVCRKKALSDRLELRRTTFEGVLMDEARFRVDLHQPLAARLDLARRPPPATQAAPGRPKLVLMPISGLKDPVLSKAQAIAERCAKSGAQLLIVCPSDTPRETAEKALDGLQVIYDQPGARDTPEHWRAVAELVVAHRAALVLLRSPSKGSARAEFFGAASFAPTGLDSRLTMRPQELPESTNLDELLRLVAEALTEQEATISVLHLPAA